MTEILNHRDTEATSIVDKRLDRLVVFTVKSQRGLAVQTSRLSSKGQVTIPKEIREAAGLSPGDLVAYELQDGTVRLRRVEPFDAVFHAALSNTLDEWNSPEDEALFGGL